MTLTLNTGAYLISMGFLAGFMDSIAGGGGLIGLPALLATGLEPVQALATNKLQSTFGASVATWNYRRAGLMKFREMKILILFTALGAMCGVLAVQVLNAHVLNALVPWVLIFIACFFLVQPKIKLHFHLKQTVWMYPLCGLVLGFYDGFFGPGTGSFWMFLFVSCFGMEILVATGHTKAVNLTSNIVSLLFFVIAGKMHFKMGGVMAIGQILGAKVGTMVALKIGGKWIRFVLIFVSLIMAIRLAFP